MKFNFFTGDEMGAQEEQRVRGLDPFTKAQQEAKFRQEMSGEMRQIANAPSRTFGEMFPSQGKAQDQARLDALGASLPGLDFNMAQGLALNGMGQQQLLQRLSERYGRDFMQNPEALQLLREFERLMQAQRSPGASEDMIQKMAGLRGM